MSNEDTALLAEDQAELDSSDNQYVTFSIDGELFAAPMGPVQEIIRVPELARVPLAPHSLLGLANLRGRILPIINLRRIFSLADISDTDNTRALVIDFGTPLGFVVDHVASVIAVDQNTVEPVSSIRSAVQTELLTGMFRMNQQIVMIVDFKALIEREFVDVIDKQSSATRDIKASVDVDPASLSTDDEAGDSENSDEKQLVSFTIAGQEYAADIEAVQEIVQLPDHIVQVPNAPHHVLGLMSLRERLLPLVSLRAMLGLPAADEAENQRILVLGLGGSHSIGMVADSVDEVLRVPLKEIEDLPNVLSRQEGMDEISSVCRLDGGKRLVSVLNTQRMFDQVDLASLAGSDTSQKGTTMNDDSNQAEDADINEDEEQVVVFRLDREEFGVPINAVQEIVRVPENLTRVPKSPSFVEGVINLRGAVLPVIDQRRRLGLEELERNDRQRIMVYAINGVRTGFIVDAVSEVLKIPNSAIGEAPKLSAEQYKIVGRMANLERQKRIILLLDPGSLLNKDELNSVSSMR